ncbi:hypothetical protein NIES2135_63360 (plasmid) [Leptolyngbya boryana NIES-2135]|uniref:DUF4396 domain-containing protein n=1 Tax=Leptolyngbya boryana NIES-2135 TaxID=1973484 RepID=A0A1Z4JRW3_LEPBY|nr:MULTISPECIES: DUF4396 domain-containing protein [Leptolyngbya]BAY59459.1 hypothetical protein NIES2135_63360 [Leptolyngbya boryana NIES-2135]
MRSKLALWIVLFTATIVVVFLTPKLGSTQSLPSLHRFIAQSPTDSSMPGMNMPEMSPAIAPQPQSTMLIDQVLLVWFSLSAIAVIYVAWDALTRNPELTIMKWGWILVTLYTGIVGAALYILSCQEPAPGEHEEFVKPLWKQTLGSTIHCMAGDATGIIVAAAITAVLGLPMWLDVISEYVFGFAFGLLIFQSLFMKDMLGGSYLKAVRRSFIPEWLSMNAVMAGMIPVMVILMSRDMQAMEATSLRFWGVMSLATLVGLVVAFPVNMWLVAVGLKHGMGTIRALGKGGHSLTAERQRIAAISGEQLTSNTSTNNYPDQASQPDISNTERK